MSNRKIHEMSDFPAEVFIRLDPAAYDRMPVYPTWSIVSVDVMPPQEKDTPDYRTCLVLIDAHGNQDVYPMPPALMHMWAVAQRAVRKETRETIEQICKLVQGLARPE
jgi:hypothetical protein